ncbi:glycosyltransferase family 4 protein [Sphingobium algorifonticola]|nr:glycosyltransferase family 4 protein [Sphingobium algorifonticola]
MVPHVDGGYRTFVNQLVPHLESAGHQVERIWLPFSGDPNSMLAEIAGFRMMDLENVCDRVICCRPPAHAIKHSQKVIWFIHHERIFYDLWDSEYNPIPKTAYWEKFRQTLFDLDKRTLEEAHLVFANSRVVASRLHHFNGIHAEVLYPPIDNPVVVESLGYGSELLFICRIEHHKRQHLAIQAMAMTQTPVRLRIAGASQNLAYLASLHEEVQRNGLQDRVTVDGRWISEGEKHHLLAQALGVVYLPLDEDSYGYPTLEGASARRATVSAHDSGGVSEFIVDGQCGLLTEPTPSALAEAFDRLWLDRGLAERLGAAAQARVCTLGINWEHVVARLTA